MIVRLSGQLVELTEDAAIVERDGMAREVLIPAYGIGQLGPQRGRSVTLHTIEFIEGNAQSGNLAPLMVGFVSAEDRLFFRRFIGVKGIGIRKALKALSEPPRRIATWIQEGDVKALSGLKGIGKRAAQQIVVDLRGKLKHLALPESAEPEDVLSEFTVAQRDALTILVEWGDSRVDAERYVTEAARRSPDIESADDWVRAAYRVRGSAGG